MRGNRKRLPKLTSVTLVLVTAAVFTGCSTYRTYRDGQIAAQQGDWDTAVAQYMRALEDDPSNIQYRAALLRAKIEASHVHFEKAKEFKEAGVLERAMLELQQAVQLDPTNQYAEAELRNVRDALEAQRREEEYPGSIQEMKDKNRGIRPQPPMLNPRSNKPISLSFPKPVEIFQIYEALGRAFGINVLFDPNLKDQPISIELQDVDAQTALETLMRTAGHFYKVIDEHTILIAADTPQNRRIYEDLVIQTFFLSNAEVKDMMTILRSLVDAKKIATNEQLNAIILRDTADKVKIAERIIEANDKAKAEVVVDVELLQLDTTELRDLGIELSQSSITQSLDLGGEDVPLRLSDLDTLTANNWVLTVPDFVYQFVKTNTNAQLLAKPRLRITDGETARLVIGDRVPIPVTTFNTGNTVGGNVVPITSFQYQEVGITIDIEPRVHHNKEITLKVTVEVSNLSGFITGSGGQQQPRIGTRTIDTTIRLRDGETNLLAGLIRTDESQSDSGVPGLSEIPVLGRLFSKKRTDSQRTDVLMTLTPHIIRNAEITEEDLQPIWVGTEANLTFRGGSPRVESDVEGPFDTGDGTPEEIQEMMRRRLQRLPRGLRQDQTEENGRQETGPPGVDLVPSGTDVFGRERQNEPQNEPPERPPERPDLSSMELIDPSAEVRLAGTGSATTEQSEAEDSLSLIEGVPTQDPVNAATAGTVVSTTADPPRVRVWLSPRSLAVQPGDTFDVRLEASAAQPVSHLPLTLTFNPEVLVVEKVEPGDFLGETGQFQVLSDTSAAGRLVIGASRLGQIPGVEGEGTVAQITFRALAPGRASLDFPQGVVLGPDLLPVEPVEVRAGRIEVVPADSGDGFEGLHPRFPGTRTGADANGPGR
jgi:general secretion pathway protein D